MNERMNHVIKIVISCLIVTVISINSVFIAAAPTINRSSITAVANSSTVEFTADTDEAILATWGNIHTLADHYDRHGADVDAIDEIDYARKAHQHFENQEYYQVKIDQAGNFRIYDSATNNFGAYNRDGTTKTFFQPSGGQAYFDRQPERSN